MYADQPPYRQELGDWEHAWDEFRKDGDYQATIGELPDRVVHRARAGYYGLMAQVDLQVNRIREALAEFGLARDTVIAFTSDHGEMMGDHRMFRKSVPYEGSARVPFIIADAPSKQRPARVVDDVVELRDLMPTLLHLAGLPIPDSVDGHSLAPYLRGEGEPVREWLHGEHVHWGQSLQWVTDGKVKYVWGSARGIEQLFDLVEDPGELRNLASLPEYAVLRNEWRGRLIQDLTGREEGFVADGELVTGRPVVTILEHTRARIAAAGS